MLLKDVLEEYEPQVIRLFMLQTHYRSPLDFSTQRLDEGHHAYERFANLVRNLRWARTAKACGLGAPEEERASLDQAVEACRDKFTAEMDDDFNTAGALAFDVRAHPDGELVHGGASGRRMRDGPRVACLVRSRPSWSFSACWASASPTRKRRSTRPRSSRWRPSSACTTVTDPAEAVEALLGERAAARAAKEWAPSGRRSRRACRAGHPHRGYAAGSTGRRRAEGLGDASWRRSKVATRSARHCAAGVPLKRLLIAEGLKPDRGVDETVRLAAAGRRSRVERVPRRELDKLSERGSHQGVIAEAAPFRFTPLEQVIASTADAAARARGRARPRHRPGQPRRDRADRRGRRARLPCSFPSGVPRR